MAERRMLAKSVMLYGPVPELPHSAQALYAQLNMHADDDGLIPNPKVVLRLMRCQKRHLQTLLDCGLLIPFESGAVAVTHWRVHNQIRKDRYKPTRCLQEWGQLTLLPDGRYALCDGDPSGNQPETQIRIGQSSVAQSSPVQSSLGQDRALAPNVPPPADSQPPLTDFEKGVLGVYQAACPSLQRCRYLSVDTRKRLKTLEAIGWTIPALEKAFSRAEQTPFLRGDNEKGWVANLDWLCLDDNLRKLLDGKYETTGRPEQPVVGCTELGAAELAAIQRLMTEE